MSTDAQKFQSLKSLKMEALSERFIKIRNAKRELVAKHEAALEPVDQALALLQSVMLAKLHEQGETSASTPFGTVYIHPSKQANIVDFEKFWEFVRENDRPDMLQRRVSSTAVFEYNEAEPDTPVPGVHITTVQEARVRAKSEK